MASRQMLSVLGTTAVVVVVGSLVVGQLLGQPLLLGFVETGSMAPALDAGDGFVAVPPFLAGNIEEGDVIVFEAENLNGGGLVTHRVVGETDSGYVTKGDANPFTDQDGREPPVAPAQVRAVALQVDGTVVTIPYLGVGVLAVQTLLDATQRRVATLFGTRAFLGTRGLAYILLGIGAITYAGSVLLNRTAPAGRNRQRTEPSRPVYDTRTLVVVLTLGVVVLATVSMVVPSGPQTIDIVSSSSDSARQGVVAAGTTEAVTYTVENQGVLPAVGFFETRSTALALERTRVFVPAGGETTITITVTAPAETGLYQYTLVRHWYLAVLPLDVITTLYRIHPWLPVLVIDAIFATGFAAFATGLVGFGRYRIRTNDAERAGIRNQISRWFD